MTETGRDVVERLRRRAELVVEPGGYGQFMEIPGHELLALLAVVEAAQESHGHSGEMPKPQFCRVCQALAALHSQASDEAGHD